MQSSGGRLVTVVSMLGGARYDYIIILIFSSIDFTTHILHIHIKKHNVIINI